MAPIEIPRDAKMEFNAAVEDYGFLSQKPNSAEPLAAVPVPRNETGMVNVIYRPRSILDLSIEYRRLRTVRTSGPATADHVDLVAGIHF